MKVEILKNVEAQQWNDWLAQSPHGSIYQTAHWGAYLAEYLNHDVLQLVCTDKGAILGLMLLSRSIPANGKLINRPLAETLSGWIKKIKPVYSWQNGPVLVGPTEMWGRSMELLIAKALEIAGDASISKSTLAPGTEQYLPAHLGEELSSMRWGTFWVDLNPSEEELWKNLKPSARKNVKRAREAGIEIEVLQGESGRIGFHRMLSSWIEHRGGQVHPVDNLLVRYRWLAPIDGEEIYVAKWGEELVGSLGIWRYNRLMHEFGANQSAFSKEKKLYCGDLLKWEIIRREKRRGIRRYDLCGVNPEAATVKEKGIFQFKKKWGGQFCEYPVYFRK